LERRGPKTKVCKNRANLRDSNPCTEETTAFKWTNNEPFVTHGKDQKSTCDHLVQLSLVKNVLEGGLCHQLARFTNEEIQAELLPIRNAINNPQTNLFMLTSALENFKGASFDKLLAGQELSVTRLGAFKAQAAGDYLRTTRERGIQTAQAVDAAIEAVFKKHNWPHTGGPTVTSQWENFLTQYEEQLVAELHRLG